jgi:hypothetical protein
MSSYLLQAISGFFNLVLSDGREDDTPSASSSEEEYDSSILDSPACIPLKNQPVLSESPLAANQECDPNCTLCQALSEALHNDS